MVTLGSPLMSHSWSLSGDNMGWQGLNSVQSQASHRYTMTDPILLCGISLLKIIYIWEKHFVTGESGHSIFVVLAG